jgi:hypothetical protein
MKRFLKADELTDAELFHAWLKRRRDEDDAVMIADRAQETSALIVIAREQLGLEPNDDPAA